MADTHIQWAEKTWNPIIGCSMVSPGCTNCYAMRMAWRLQHNPKLNGRYAGIARKTEKGKAIFTGKVKVVKEVMRQPYRWKKPQRIFVNSMSDLFHDGISANFYVDFWKVVRENPQHQFLILTKRPQNISARLPEDWGDGYDNVWLLVSIENQKQASERILQLLSIKAKVRGLSCEPLLSSLIIPDCIMQRLDWIVVGGESGPNARKMEDWWAHQLITDAKRNKVAAFMKQFGTVAAKEMKLQSRAGGDFANFPKEYQIREYPTLT